MKNKTPTSRLIYQIVFEKDKEIMIYLERERLKFLKEEERKRLIKRDMYLIEERGKSLNNYFFTTNITLEELYKILFLDKMFNKLTFSEQIVLIELFNKIIKLLETKEKLSIKEIDKNGRLLEQSLLTLKNDNKIEYQRDEYNKVLAYWNSLNTLKRTYIEKVKELKRGLNYTLGVHEDILEASATKFISSQMVIKNEEKLMKNRLIISSSIINEIKELELMSEEEKEKIKKLKIGE